MTDLEASNQVEDSLTALVERIVENIHRYGMWKETARGLLAPLIERAEQADELGMWQSAFWELCSELGRECGEAPFDFVKRLAEKLEQAERDLELRTTAANELRDAQAREHSEVLRLRDRLAAVLKDVGTIDIVFDGPPGPEPGRFVEVEDSETRASLTVGEWVERDDGYWVLRLRAHRDATEGEPT